MKGIAMSDATLTSKGQTTIPKDIREGLGLKTGDRLSFTLLSDGTVVLRVKTRLLTDLAGLLHMPAQAAVPVEDMSPWN
jgi:antitoxin PrlF